nr:hypothetical protein [Sinorhizobium meliloti]
MMDYLLLAASGFIAWIVSTIGGGGGAILLVPLIGFIAGAQAVAPVWLSPPSLREAGAS